MTEIDINWNKSQELNVLFLKCWIDVYLRHDDSIDSF